MQGTNAAKDRLLNKITHIVLVMTKTREIAEKTGIHGVFFLCFGATDADRIGQVHLVKNGNRFSWEPPHVQGQNRRLPVFTGKIALEIVERVQEAYDTIRKQIGKGRYGRRYRVAGGKATEEAPESQAGAA